MGISHEYHSMHHKKHKNPLPMIICVAVIILILSAAITAILQKNTEEQNAAARSGASGTSENILAPLPMQSTSSASDSAAEDNTETQSESQQQTADSTAQAEVQLEKFGPSCQSSGAYSVKAYDSSVISQQSNGQVDLSYFSDAAFLGDSLTVGFVDYKIDVGGALICGYTGVGPEAIVNRSTVKSSLRGDEVALDVLAEAQPKKLYILLGTNTLTTAGTENRFIAYYGQMLDELRKVLSSDCIIYVQSIPPVRPSVSQEKPGLTSANIQSVNERLAALAAQKGCVYLNLWDAFADGEGNLKELLAAPDGIHLTGTNGYGAWVTYLRNHAKYSAANQWTEGSAFALN